MSLLNLQAIRTQLTHAEPCVLAGRVTRASGIVVEAALPQVAVGTSCEIHATGNRIVAAEVVGFAGSQAILMPFGDVRGIGEGCAVIPRASAGEIVVGEALLGRVVDAAMRPLDGMPAPILHTRVPLHAPPPPAMSRACFWACSRAVPTPTSSWWGWWASAAAKCASS